MSAWIAARALRSFRTDPSDPEPSSRIGVGNGRITDLFEHVRSHVVTFHHYLNIFFLKVVDWLSVVVERDEGDGHIADGNGVGKGSGDLRRRRVWATGGPAVRATGIATAPREVQWFRSTIHKAHRGGKTFEPIELFFRIFLSAPSSMDLVPEISHPEWGVT